MAEPALVSFWSNYRGAGRRTVARALAQHWTEYGQNTLIIDVQGDVIPITSPDPSVWVPRFRSLAPAMLCNFLSDFPGAPACLKLSQLPECVLLKELLDL